MSGQIRAAAEATGHGAAAAGAAMGRGALAAAAAAGRGAAWAAPRIGRLSLAATLATARAAWTAAKHGAKFAGTAVGWLLNPDSGDGAPEADAPRWPARPRHDVEAHDRRGGYVRSYTTRTGVHVRGYSRRGAHVESHRQRNRRSAAAPVRGQGLPAGGMSANRNGGGRRR